MSAPVSKEPSRLLFRKQKAVRTAVRCGVLSPDYQSMGDTYTDLRTESKKKTEHAIPSDSAGERHARVPHASYFLRYSSIFRSGLGNYATCENILRKMPHSQIFPYARTTIPGTAAKGRSFKTLLS